MVGKHCYDCKYYMWGVCLHKERSHCNHSELWIPVGFGEYDISIFDLPNDIGELLKCGIYTKEEIIKIIKEHGINRLTRYETVGGHVHAIPSTTDMDAIVAKLAEYEDAEQNGRLIFLDEDSDI